MASTIRYDFSFPPKSNTSNKTTNTNNYFQNDISLTRSTSAIYLPNSNFSNYSTKNTCNQSTIKTPVTAANAALNAMNGGTNTLAHAMFQGALVTPKDPNCSFSKK